MRLSTILLLAGGWWFFIAQGKKKNGNGKSSYTFGSDHPALQQKSGKGEVLSFIAPEGSPKSAKEGVGSAFLKRKGITTGCGDQPHIANYKGIGGAINYSKDLTSWIACTQDYFEGVKNQSQGKSAEGRYGGAGDALLGSVQAALPPDMYSEKDSSNTLPFFEGGADYLSTLRA